MPVLQVQIPVEYKKKEDGSVNQADIDEQEEEVPVSYMLQLYAIFFKSECAKVSK